MVALFSYTTYQDHDTIRLRANVILNATVCHVQVVGLGRELGGQGIDLLDTWLDSQL